MAQLAAFEVPDLDLGPAPAPAPAARPRAKGKPQKIELGLDLEARSPSRPPPAAAAPQADAAAIDLDDSALGGPSIELAASPGRPVSVRPPPPAAAPPERSAGPRSVPPPRAPARSLSEEADAYAVKQAAGFGPAPGSLLEAPLYAFRVMTRVREMRAELLVIDADQQSIQQSISDAMAQFLDRSAEVFARDTALARCFDPVKEAQAAYLARLKVVEELDAQGQKELGEIDQEILRCERTAQEGRSTREGLSTEAARLFESARDGDSLAAQLLDAIRAQISQSEADATQAIAQMTELRRKRREVEQGYIERMRDLEGALAEADKPRRAALNEVQQTLVERPRPFELPEMAEVNLALKKLHERAQRKALLNQALTSYDRKKVTEGVVAFSAVVLLILGAFALGVVRMNRELSAPPPVVPTL